MNDVDISWVHTGIDDQFLVARHHIEQPIPGPDHRAFGVDLHIHHHAIGGADHGRAPLHVLGGTQTFLQVEQFGLHLAQFGHHLAHLLGAQFKDTDFRFGDVLLGAGNRCKVLAPLALNLCPPALQCEQTRFRGQPLVEQQLQIGQLALDQAQLFVCRANLRFEPNDLFVELGDALPENLALSLTMLIGSGFLLFLALSLATPLTRSLAFELEGWIVVLILAIPSAALMNFMWGRALQLITPTQATITVGINPITALLLGAWLLSEPITWRVLGGVVLLISAIVLTNHRSRKKPAPPTTADPL